MNDNTIDLDNDPRPAEDQAADFFNRPGNYHQVRIEVPEATNAECVIKVTDEQLPLAIEILRQIRGTLFARITLTRLHNAVEAPSKYTVVDAGPREYGRTINTCEPFAEDIARAHNVPVEWVHRVPSPTGDTAWTITPPAQPRTGRHAKPDNEEPLTITARTWLPGDHIDEIHDAAYGDDDQ